MPSVNDEAEIERKHWGEMESEESESEDEAEMAEEDEENKDDDALSGLTTPAEGCLIFLQML